MINRTIAASALVVGLLGSVSGCAWINDRFGDGSRQATAGQSMDDRTITSRVKDRLGEDRSIDAKRIHVDTLRGTVQLSGFVNTQAERTKAAKIARDVPEVKAVRDDIIVSSSN